MVRWGLILSLFGVIPLSSVTFGRKYRVLVADEKITALDVSQLRVIFEIEKIALQIANYAFIKIYNLNEVTENAIINEGARVIVEAGYDNGIYGTIFDGKILQFLRSKEDNLDYVLTLVCLDGDSFLSNNYINLTLNAGQNKRQVIEAVCNQAMVTTEIGRVSPDISSERLPRGKVLFGDPKQYLRDVAKDQRAGFYVENGKVYIERATDIAEGSALVLTPKTGLIGTPEQTQEGVGFRTLLDPRIKLKTMIKLDQSYIRQLQQQIGQYPVILDQDGQYQAYRVRHIGDSRGNDWYTEVDGVGRYGTIPTLLNSALQSPF
jgi:hypothetical protein